MKKNTQNYRVLFFTSFACLFAVVSLLSSCDLFAYKRIFPDAYYEDNLIEKIGFSLSINSNAPITAADPVSGNIEPSAIWDFAWRYENDYAVGTIPYPYMTLLNTGNTADHFGSTPAGLSPSSPVFRLEVENLVKDGDFEAVTPPDVPANWNSNLAPTKFKVFTGSGTINGNSLQINMSKNTEFAKYGINMPAGAAVIEKSYDLFFKWNSSDPLTSTSGTYTVNETGISFSNSISEKVNFTSEETNELKLHNKTISNLVIDDIMLKRTLNMQELRLRLSPGDTEPPLMNLLYTFSLWVCADPSVDPVKSPYHLSGFTLGIDQLQTTQIDSMTILPGVYTYKATLPGWQKIVASVSDGGNPQFSEDSLEPVIDLVISLAHSLPGRVLIAQPELRAYPDGY